MYRNELEREQTSSAHYSEKTPTLLSALLNEIRELYDARPVVTVLVLVVVAAAIVVPIVRLWQIHSGLR